MPVRKRKRLRKKKLKKEKYDKVGVKSIYSPFNRFAFVPRASCSKPTKRLLPYESRYGGAGLSTKEKMYLITSFQTRSHQYTKLKKLATNAIKNNKIFSICGPNNTVRNALIERGWVEKIPPNKMNLTKLRNGTYNKQEIYIELEKLLLSSFVEKQTPNFIWRTTDEIKDTTIDMKKDDTTMINKLNLGAMWATKQGLCSSIKRNYWFYIENIAEVNSPRTYNSYEYGEIDGFIKDFKITACTSLLKWVLAMVANNRPVFVESGQISINVILFALNRCKEYLFRKQNIDIDRTIGIVSTGQWNTFLKSYYRIISKTDVFQADKKNLLPLYLSYAKFLLQEMFKYRPQLSCEGCHNIWIAKPAHNSRGRGISLHSKLGELMDMLTKPNSKFVVQKYIEEPMLIHETKFDIRQYYLITSTYPLVIWMYKDCYLKFSSQKYSLRDYHISIHLTNNAVQRKYKNCQNRHEELPLCNMWDSDTYKSYLSRIGEDKVWDDIIYPGMKQSIIGIMLSCQDTLSACKNRFELYGCDFILDKSYKPWLIEINSCPDLQHTTPVTAKICPAVVTDIIKVVIDLPNDPSSSTGRFECIYHQPITIPRFLLSGDLYVRGYALPPEYFYKGNIEIEESYDDSNIGKQRNIKGIMRKMKQVYNEDILLETKDNEECKVNENNVDDTHLTESDIELSKVASCITQQLDELLDRVTAGSDSNVKKKTSDTEDNIKLIENVKIFNTILNKLSTSHRPSNPENAKDTFKFSPLDDGPLGKASWIDLSPSCSTVEVSAGELQRELKKITKIIANNNNNISDYRYVTETAVKKLISFLNEKERET